MGKGIDYGMGRTNVDYATGIRFGVIGLNSDGLTEWVWESLEADYGPPACGRCGTEAKKGRRRDYRCPSCKREFDSQDAYGEEPTGHTLDSDGYKGTVDSYSDLFLTQSPFFTRAQFCSPCAPGACHLENPDPDGDRCYCLGHDWFDGGIAPYPVYSVETGAEVMPAGLEEFTRAYLECALFASTLEPFGDCPDCGKENAPLHHWRTVADPEPVCGDCGVEAHHEPPADDNWNVSDLAPDALASMREDCRQFLRTNRALIPDERIESAGHDFWLTRNRHGAGFWDRGHGFYPDGAAEKLTEDSHAWGESNLYVGDDGKVHVS